MTASSYSMATNQVISGALGLLNFLPTLKAYWLIEILSYLFQVSNYMHYMHYSDRQCLYIISIVLYHQK